jgi:hypothetical protein
METLADPYGDRVVKDLAAPPIHPLSEAVMYPNSGNFYKLLSLLRLYGSLYPLDFRN